MSSVKESNSRVPDFYVVGAAKAGTTSLWHYLKQHPGLFLVSDFKHKELAYFASDHGMSNRDQYTSFFKEANPNQLIGEVCNSYLTDLKSATLIKEEVPKAKIIIILRDPIQRAKSLWRWMLQEGYETIDDFNMALIEEENRINDSEFKQNNAHGNYWNFMYKASGLYYNQVKRYYDVFGKDNCFVCLFDELESNTESLMQRMYNFLELKEEHIQIEYKIQNVSGSVRFPKFQRFLRQTAPKIRDKMSLPKGLLSKPINYLLKKNKTNKKQKISLDKEILNSIESYFREDINKTAKLIDKDLSKWLK